MENLARYIIRASFSQEKLNYISEYSRVIYKSKNGSDTREFDSLDFIACLSSHIPNKNEQMVRYVGYYSNVCRSRRKKILLMTTKTNREPRVAALVQAEVVVHTKEEVDNDIHEWRPPDHIHRVQNGRFQ